MEEEKLEEADDADDVKGTLVELIVEKAREHPPSTVVKPHFGAADSGGSKAEPEYQRTDIHGAARSALPPQQRGASSQRGGYPRRGKLPGPPGASALDEPIRLPL